MKRSSSDSTPLIVVGLLVAARSIRWFTTPLRHSHAGAAGYTATWFLLATGLAMIGYGFYMRRRDRDGAFTD